MGGDSVCGEGGRAAVSGVKPWGNTSPYDLMVERDGAIHRVQVKSTTSRVSAHAYSCRTPSGKRLTHILKEFDFVAAYVIPLDLWYVIPAGDGGKAERVYYAFALGAAEQV
ncbi:MAG: group I intron-associated PD-(D/E)XK endonuclease [Candidatus Sulfotelmatobacter sp.]